MIQKNPNGTYTVRVGRSSPRKTFDFRKEAVEYEADLRKNRRREKAGMEIEKGPITYDALCDLWEAAYAPSRWKSNMLKHSRKRWGKVMVRSIPAEQVGQWINSMKAAPKTRTHILAAMRQVLSAGIEWGYLSKSPARPGVFAAPGSKRTSEIVPFESWAEVMAVASAIGATGPLVRLICATGLTSPSEWIDARWNDVDLKAREMIVHGTKTENRQRTIPLGARAIEALENLKAMPRSIDGRIIVGKTGRRFDYHDWRKNDWPLALLSADLEPRTPNQMRHSFAVLALQGNVPIDDVADILGHSSVEITYRFYRKWTKKMAARSRALLDKIGEEEDAGTDALSN